MRASRPIDRTSVRTFDRALPKSARRRLRIAYVNGVPNAVCALLPWVLPPTITALAVLAATSLRWSEATTLFACVGAFVAALILAFGVARAIESATLYARLQSLESGRLPVCPQCSYNQQGSSSDRCPECGCTTRM